MSTPHIKLRPALLVTAVALLLLWPSTAPAQGDTVPPVPGNSGIITTTNITSSSLTLNWTRANDAVTTQSLLQYEVRSSFNNNMGTVLLAESNGTVIQPYTTNIASMNVSGVFPPTYFTVIVKDAAGNKAVYGTTGMPQLLSMVPSSGLPGQTLSVTITGQFTHFQQGVTTVSFGSEITVNGFTVNSPTVVVVSITIGPNVSVNLHPMQVVTGGERIFNSFNVIADTTPAVPGSSGTITTSSITATSLTLNWTKAIDNASSQSALQYEVRRSGSSNLGTVATAEANGTIIGAYNADINTFNVAGLTASTTYFFNVIVKDAVGNKAVYATVNATTTAPTLTISPSSGSPGQTLSINMTGTGTHFVNGVTTADFGPNITVNSVTVTNATFAVANITIGMAAATGARTMTVTTGMEIVNKTFTVAGGDLTPPVPGNSGTISVSSISSTSATLTWTKAIDNLSSQAALQYEVRGSLSNNIATVANAEANGTIVLAYTADVATFSLTNLTPSTSYFFNVIVKDAAGNKAIYATVNGTTTELTTITLTATPNPITLGQSTTLEWIVTNAASVTMNNGVGNVRATGGTMVITPNITTTFTATAMGPNGGRATSSVVVTVVTANYNLPSNAAQVLGVGDATAPLGISSVILQPAPGTETPNGNGVIGYRPAGIWLVEAATPALRPISSGRFYTEIGSNTNIGVAFTNPGTSTAIIDFYFTDSNGVSTPSRTTTLDAGKEFSGFLNESPFDGVQPFVGSFTFSSSIPLAALGIKSYQNERGDFLFTTLPVSPLGPSPSTSGPSVIPLYASGGGWTTELILTNTTNTSQAGTVRFVAQDGGPAMTLVNGAVNSTFNYLVPAQGAFRMLAANGGNATVVGSILVSPTATSTEVPFATAVFAYKDGPVTVSQSSVSASPRSTSYRLYVERLGANGSPGSTKSGVAITNASAVPVTVNLELRQLDGQLVAFLTPPALPAGGQMSSFIDELFPAIPTTFRGTLRVSVVSGSGVASIAVTGIRARINERQDFLFAATPASDENAATYTGPLVFTHIVSGGGYTTQIILFGDAATTTGGRLFHMSKDGVLLPTNSLQTQP